MKISAFNVKEQGLRAGPTDQLLYDFDFAQFYRQAGHADDDYGARGVMLLRDDYLVLSDEVKSPDVAGTFQLGERLRPAANLSTETGRAGVG